VHHDFRPREDVKTKILPAPLFKGEAIWLGTTTLTLARPSSVFPLQWSGSSEIARVKWPSFSHTRPARLGRSLQVKYRPRRRRPPTLSGELDRLLGRSGRNLLAEQRTCESRADTIGFAMFTDAGYNPFDAAEAFGRLEMYSGDVSSGIVARLAALGRAHPMTPDRIAHMRTLLIASLRESAGQ
jgi:hypothetical protein